MQVARASETSSCSGADWHLPQQLISTSHCENVGAIVPENVTVSYISTDARHSTSDVAPAVIWYSPASPIRYASPLGMHHHLIAARLIQIDSTIHNKRLPTEGLHFDAEK